MLSAEGRWFTRKTMPHFACLGHSALATLAARAGQARKARRHVEQSLALSSDIELPFHRWRCLQAAGRLTDLDAALDGERVALAERFGRLQRHG